MHALLASWIEMDVEGKLALILIVAVFLIALWEKKH